MIEITTAQRDEMIAHALEDAPNECCGLLFGTVDGSSGHSERLLRMENDTKAAQDTKNPQRCVLHLFPGFGASVL